MYLEALLPVDLSFADLCKCIPVGEQEVLQTQARPQHENHTSPLTLLATSTPLAFSDDAEAGLGTSKCQAWRCRLNQGDVVVE